MAGGGVGEAMLIGAAVGAGTGAVSSAVQKKDVLQGALLGGAMGAAGGGIGAGIGGAASGAASGATSGAVEGATGTALTDTAAGTLGSSGVGSAGMNNAIGQTLAQQTGEQAAAQSIASPVSSIQPYQSGMSLTGPTGSSVSGVGNYGNIAGTAPQFSAAAPSSGAAPAGGVSDLAKWGQAGKGTGFAPSLTNAQAYGAGTAGGVMGLVGQSSQNQNNMAPGPETYTGPLSQFKYSPNTFRPSVAPGYAEGGITSLASGGVQQTGMFPQSQMDKTQFAIPSQMPISREIIGSDYDSTISPYTGDIPRFDGGGSIGMVRALQPGGEWGAATSDMYGAVQEHKPQWLQNAEPGGFVGSTVPGKMDYEDKKRAEVQAAAAEQAAIDQEEERKKRMQAFLASSYGLNSGESVGMASGGIYNLGGYSDGGRLLRGPGDGMSDNIPASIAGKQPARLADGEFVVPADVVSGIGNGSTDAGAKKLYGMMDNIRKARTGTKKQGKNIKAEKYIPGMAAGGVARYDDGGETTSDTMPSWFSNWLEAQKPATVPGQGAISTGFQPTGYSPSQQYTPYTMMNRPSSSAPQNYGNIYRGSYQDFSTPGYTLTGGNLGRWSNVAGEAQRAAQPASPEQRLTQQFLQTRGGMPSQAAYDTAFQQQQTAGINSQVADMYKKYLGRSPEQAGLAYWTNQMDSGAMTPSQVSTAIQASPESQIRQAYQQYLGRTADQAGQQYWSDRVGSGDMTLSQALGAIQSSDEGKAYAAKQAAPEEKKRKGGIASLV